MNIQPACANLFLQGARCVSIDEECWADWMSSKRVHRCQHFEKIPIVSSKKTIFILYRVDTVIECLTVIRFLMTFDSKCTQEAEGTDQSTDREMVEGWTAAIQRSRTETDTGRDQHARRMLWILMTNNPWTTLRWNTRWLVCISRNGRTGRQAGGGTCRLDWPAGGRRPATHIRTNTESWTRSLSLIGWPWGELDRG